LATDGVDSKWHRAGIRNTWCINAKEQNETTRNAANIVTIAQNRHGKRKTVRAAERTLQEHRLPKLQCRQGEIHFFRKLSDYATTL